jgi:NADH-quinone oxidoreductase subunit M
MPAYALVFMVFTMASVALPGTANFPGEFLVITGAWRSSAWVALGAATGMILGAAYMLWLYRRVVFSKVTRDEVRGLLDLSPRELAIFAPLILLTLWMGLYPSSFTHVWEVSVAALLERHEAALAVPRVAGL